MTIAGTLSSALSGLTANARAAEIVSSNIANAMTDGYGRREIITSSRQIGGVGQGVEVIGVYRHADMALIGDRRVADSGAGNQRTRSDFLSRLERVLGTPGEEYSLSGRIAAFDTALIEASSRPESESRLSRVADTARALTAHLADVSTDIQAARTSADAAIKASVRQLNTALTRVGELNSLIRTNSGTGRDSSALMDQRQQMIDSIAAIVPVRELARDNGQIALVTTGGATLIEGPVSQLTFQPVGQITYGMVSGGALSGLSLNGKPIATAGDSSPIAGGSLAGHFLVRDELAIEAQARIDAVARDLIDRFAATGLDPTRGQDAPGLFTDAGGAFGPANETGLAQRLRLNPAADPAAGGALWRLRDGLGADTAGPAGNAQLLTEWHRALTAQQPPASSFLMAGERSLATLAADMLSGVAADRLTADGEAGYAQARAQSLRSMELMGGVDTDQEMQMLLLIEQNYAANARVVKAVDDMIQLLLGM